MDEKKTGHTPGPWRTDRLGEYVQADGLLVADLARSQAAAREANARLIAAAPDMAAMLGRIFDWDCKAGDAGLPTNLSSALAGVLHNAGAL